MGLAIAIKPTLALLVLFFVWKRAYRTVGITLCLAAVIAAPAFAVAGGLAAVFDYVAVARYWSSASFAVSPVNQSTYGLLLRLFTENPFATALIVAPGLVIVVQAVLSVVALAALLMSIGRTRPDDAGHRLALEFGLALTVLLVISPLAEESYYTYLVITLGAIAAALVHRRGQPALVVAAVIVFAYLCIPRLAHMDHAFWTYYDAPLRFPMVLMTGMHLYGLYMVTVLALTATRWHRSRLDGMNPVRV